MRVPFTLVLAFFSFSPLEEYFIRSIYILIRNRIRASTTIQRANSFLRIFGYYTRHNHPSKTLPFLKSYPIKRRPRRRGTTLFVGGYVRVAKPARGTNPSLCGRGTRRDETERDETNERKTRARARARQRRTKKEREREREKDRERSEIHLRIETGKRTSRRGITGINTSRNYRVRERHWKCVYIAGVVARQGNLGRVRGEHTRLHTRPKRA